MFDEGVYANYAPASLYSNYSNYSELEVPVNFFLKGGKKLTGRLMSLASLFMDCILSKS